MPKHNILLIFLAIVLILEQFLPSFRYNFFIQLICFFLLLISANNLKINAELLKTITPLILIFLVGFIGLLYNHKGLTAIIKDFTFFLKPILALFIGYSIFKSQKDPLMIFKFIVYLGAIIAFFHFFGVLFFGNLASNSIHKIRGIFGLDNFIEIFAFYILIFSKKYLGFSMIKNQTFYYALMALLLGSIFLYFSRTMLIAMVLVGLSILGYTKITQKSIKYMLSFMLVVGLFFVVLSQIKFNRNAKGIEAFFYKVQIAPQEIFNARINRDDHKQLWDRFRAYEAKRALTLMEGNLFNYIVGVGHGSLVNLKFKAPLGGEDLKYISRLHNGYVFVFYKTGMIGLMIYLYLLVKLFWYNQKKHDNLQIQFKNYLISAIGLFYLFTSIIISGIYIPRDLIIFLLGGIIALNLKPNQESLS